MEAYKALICGILLQAVEDWRKLSAGDIKASANNNLTEIRAFLQSDYCAFIMTALSITPDVVLEQLESIGGRTNGNNKS